MCPGPLPRVSLNCLDIYIILLYTRIHGKTLDTKFSQYGKVHRYNSYIQGSPHPRQPLRNRGTLFLAATMADSRCCEGKPFALITEQRDEAKRFWYDKSIRTAMIVPWAEAFTVAFLVPVYPFFMQGLGIDASGMGQLRTVQLLLTAASAPFAGYLLDTRGPFMGIALPSSLCAIGCFIRATATGYGMLFGANVISGLGGSRTEMSLAHLTRYTEPSRRTLAVSSAKVQLQILTLIGTA